MSNPENSHKFDESKPIPEPDKDLVLTHKEAEAASPDDYSASGEEDPGVGLEDLVTHEEK